MNHTRILSILSALIALLARGTSCRQTYEPSVIKHLSQYWNLTFPATGSLIDAEIARQRTMIDYQKQLFVSRLKFLTDGMEVRNATIAPLIN